MKLILIWLTDWEDNKCDIAVDPNDIKSMRRLPAKPADKLLEAEALSERTRVNTSNDMFLVKETPKEIIALVEKLNETLT